MTSTTTPPEGLHSMKNFDPSDPAILHDVLKDKIVTWDWERSIEFRAQAVHGADGRVRFKDYIFDGWGNVLGG